MSEVECGGTSKWRRCVDLGAVHGGILGTLRFCASLVREWQRWIC